MVTARSAAAPTRDTGPGTPNTGRRQTVDVPIIGSMSRLNGLFLRGFTRDTYPDTIRLETYDEMRLDAVLKAGLYLLQLPLLANLQHAEIACDDPTVKAAATEVHLGSGLLYRTVRSMCSSFAFGAAFHEKKWEPETLTIQVEEDDPLGGGIKEQEQVVELLNITKMYSVNPSTVSEIRHTPDGSFDGFVQGFVAGRAITSPELNPSGWVKPVNALVYANDPEFGNMWGVSLLKAAYPYWFWKQVVLKLWMAWAEKKAQPTRIIRHPQGIDPLTNIDYRDLALIIANQIDSVSAVAMPNTREGSIAGERGDYMWTIDELTVTDRTDTFERVVKKLDQYMLWSIMVPERVFQEGQFGTRAEAVAQTDTFLLLEDARLRDMLDAYNQWVLEPWRLRPDRQPAHPGSAGVHGDALQPGEPVEHRLP
jgi:hypothetical protein